MTAFLDFVRDRVLLLDGAMGSQIQARNLSVEKDFWGQENCSEILNLSRPDLIREIHRGYLAAGADAVETNSFGGSAVTLGEFDLADRTLEINRRAAELAREACDSFKGDGRTRFVVGSIGPGTRLPSLGHIDYRSLEDAFAVQAEGLIAGTADALLIETCQDPLQIKAAINGSRRAFAKSGHKLPLMVQVTIETTGTMLVGTDIAAATVVLDAMGVDMLGLNCATGPKEMAEHIRHLTESWAGPVSVLPNAGLPELRCGHTHYPLSAADLAMWIERFVTEDGVNVVGGCCGTTAEHIGSLDAMLRRIADDGFRPRPKPRKARLQPSLASLFGAVQQRQENAYLAIGERCNANGSKKFRELQEAHDWDGCVAMGREQAREGSHAIDLCTAFVGRDEKAEMVEVAMRMRGQVDAPIVFDSTELPVLEAAIELYGGKGVLNSINFEDGEAPAEARMRLARKLGHAVIALTIDEQGMAKTAEDKLRIAERLVAFACGRFGLARHDLMIDPLTFTIATGNEDDRKLGAWTLEGIERIHAAFPEVQIILGLSNISFGLNPAARHVLNSVFLDHAVKRGMTGAIVHASKIMPLHKIPEIEVRTAEDLIFDRRRDGYDPLQAFMALFADRKASAGADKVRAETVEERLKQRIVDGDKQGLEADLDLALKTYAPLDIINTHLLDGMKVVGELFGAGKMQLPFVLQSAEVMKQAVAYLEPHMEKSESTSGKGTLVLATVRGDVHDIGKNLVDIIVSNNGYTVVNIGIKQPIQAIIDAAREHAADAIGMSGLLVKSTLVMKDNLLELNRLGLSEQFPVLLGGAALTRTFVEHDLNDIFDGEVRYAKDAFEGLALMDAVMAVKQGVPGAALPEPRQRRHAKTSLVEIAEPELGVRSDVARRIDVPTPPFWGSRVVKGVQLAEVAAWLDHRATFMGQWGLKSLKDGPSFEELVETEALPRLRMWLDRIKTGGLANFGVVYGYFPVHSHGETLVVGSPDDPSREVARFTFPRQRRGRNLCLADFFRDEEEAAELGPDVLAMQLVTMGSEVARETQKLFEANAYRDYLELHGLSVQLTEALAELWHGRVRDELGLGAADGDVNAAIRDQAYRGSRYSFGYPACPNLEDRATLVELLDPSRIGVELSEELQLHPEQSTDAIVVHHPEAKYFNAG